MKRLKTEPVAWHVFARGARRLGLFYEPSDYEKFIELLRYGLTKSFCSLWAYTLMSNHYHLILYGSMEQITACMRRVNFLFSKHHNKGHGVTGHTFDGPYNAYFPKSPYLLRRLAAYVFLNPVAAGMVKDALEYPWSSYKSFLGLECSPLPVDTRPIMEMISNDVDSARQLFREFVNQQRAEAEPDPSKALTAREANALQYRWLLEHARQRADFLEGEDPQLVAMHWAHEIGVPPRVLASVTGEEPSSGFRSKLMRFEKKLRKNPALAVRLALP